MSEQKEITKAYFDKVVRDWMKRAYDPEDKFLTFPTGKVRKELTISEIRRLNAGKNVIDLGCGTGHLVIDLLKNGYNACGVDNAPNMISEARKMLMKELPTLNNSEIFQVKDVLDLEIDGKFDVVTAMGLMEYLEDDISFFMTVKKLLNRGGYAFIECRNRLFNIASGNQYTLEAADSEDLKNLISQLDRIQKYSPLSIEEIQEIQTEVFSKIAETLEGDSEGKIFSSDEVPSVKKFPKRMKRRQHTPEEMESILGQAGLKLRYVVYFHYHPYLPRYERLFPVIFNKIALIMQPMGYTPLGATICSAFIAVIEKSRL